MTAPAAEPAVEERELPLGLVALLVLREPPSDAEVAVNALLAGEDDGPARRRRRGAGRARKAAQQRRTAPPDDDFPEDA